MKKDGVPILGIVLMAVLAQRSTPTTGYELAMILKPVATTVWPSKHSQIYPMLARLEKLGLIDGKWVTQSGKPDKRLYSLNAKGERHIVEWASHDIDELNAPKDTIVVRSLISTMSGYDAFIPILYKYRKSCQKRIDDINARLKILTWKGSPPPNVERIDIPKYSTYYYAICIFEGRIKWCDFLLKHYVSQ